MKAVVFAYHNMGVIGIRSLLKAGYDIPLVFTHADSTTENIWFASVAKLCSEHGIACVTPESPNTPAWIEKIRDLRLDSIFSFMYRNMLSREILRIPQAGAYNLHPSYLPAYRGRCPVNWVLINGERYTGVTLHEMVEKPDAGSIVAQKKVAITEYDTPLTLYAKLDDAAKSMLADILPRMRQGAVPKTPQDLALGSYYGGRKPDDGRIVWQRSAVEIYNLIRGVTRPYPGAFCHLDEKKLIIWQTMLPADGLLEPGRIYALTGNVMISTGKGALMPTEIEIDGKVLSGEKMQHFFYKLNGSYLA